MRILISGSYPHILPQNEKSMSISKLAWGIGRRVIQEGHQLVSGMGPTVGSEAVRGAEDVLDEDGHESRIIKKPFPFDTAPTDPTARQAYFAEHRKNLLADCDLAIFISGEKLVEDRFVIADGVRTEFDLCGKYDIKVVPLGTMGGMSQQLWSSVDASYDKYLKNCDRQLFEQLKLRKDTPKDDEIPQIVEILFQLVHQMSFD